MNDQNQPSLFEETESAEPVAPQQQPVGELRPFRDYDPNARRAEQAQGAGGGISSHLSGELKDGAIVDGEAITGEEGRLLIKAFQMRHPIKKDLLDETIERRKKHGSA